MVKTRSRSTGRLQRKTSGRKKQYRPPKIENANFRGKIERMSDQQKRGFMKELLTHQYSLLLARRKAEEAMQREDERIKSYTAQLKTFAPAAGEPIVKVDAKTTNLLNKALDRKLDANSRQEEIKKQERVIADAIGIIHKHLTSKIARQL